jgi:hypothetical protein
MSNHSPSTSPSPDASPEAAPLAWMLALLRNAMERVMTDDPPPLKQVNALVRLGSLYLKSYNTTELERVNAELVERVAELEERMTARVVEAAGDKEVATDPQASRQGGGPPTSQLGEAKRSKPQPNGKQLPDVGHPSRPHLRGKAAGRRR